MAIDLFGPDGGCTEYSFLEGSVTDSVFDCATRTLWFDLNVPNLKANRRFVVVQPPEVLNDRTRIRAYFRRGDEEGYPRRGHFELMAYETLDEMNQPVSRVSTNADYKFLNT